MGDKAPKKQNAKKPNKSLKEKRADKQSNAETNGSASASDFFLPMM